MTNVELGWLAGLFDSEGSVSISRNQPKGRPSIFTPLIQMETTHEGTAIEAKRLVDSAGCRMGAYFYRARKPQHKPSWSLRVGRLADVRVVARIMAPVSVTKKDQWRLVLEFIESRLDGAVVLPDGRVKRGGKEKRPYTKREVEIYEQLRILNARGPRRR